MPELSIFATTKPFHDQFARIQRNAVWSWAQLRPRVDVTLIGDDDGAADIAAEFDIGFVPTVARSPKNVPRLDDLWKIGQATATADVCLFLNADIVLTDDILDAIAAIQSQSVGPYLAVGQRWDLECDDDLAAATDHTNWDAHLRNRARKTGRLNSPLWVDWFAFPRHQYPDLPSFIVGRPGYDHWLVWHTLDRSIPVVDATDAVTVIHQHHDYSHGGSHQDVWFGDDARHNKVLIGDPPRMRHIGHATHRLDTDLTLQPARGTKYTLSRAHSHLAPVLARTAHVRHRIGLDAERLQSIGTRIRRTRSSTV